MNFAWIRVLKVTLTNKFGSTRTYGGVGSNTFSISAKIDKYLSCLKDSAIIRIANIDYSEILEVIRGEFFDISIYAGYKNGNVTKVFEGGVLYASNSLNDIKTNKLILICTSKLIAKFGQAKMSLTLNSSINLYSAIKFIARRANVDSYHIDDELKKYKIDVNSSLKNASIQSWLNEIANAYDIAVSTDSSSGSTLSVSSLDFENLETGRILTILNNAINLSGGYPRCTDDGVDLTAMVVADFMPGDIVQLDNSILDISANSINEVSKVYGNHLSLSGLYKIWEVHYVLENRSSQFSANLICKAKPQADIDRQNTIKSHTKSR